MAPEEDENGPESTEAGSENTVNWEGDIHGSPYINISQVNIEGVPAKEHAKVLEELKELKKELGSARSDIIVVQGRRLFEDRSREPSEEELESARKSVRIAMKLIGQKVIFKPWDLLSFGLSALSLADDRQGEMWDLGLAFLSEAGWEFVWKHRDETIPNDGQSSGPKTVARGVVELYLNWGKVFLLESRDKTDKADDWRKSYFESSRVFDRGYSGARMGPDSKEGSLLEAEAYLWEAFSTLTRKCANGPSLSGDRGEENYVERKMADIMCLLAEIALERSELDSAKRIYQGAYGIAFGTGHWRLEYQILSALADLAVRRDDVEEAESLLDESIVLSYKHRDWYGERRGWIRLAEVADQQGDAEKAEEIRSAIELRRVQHYAHEVDHNDS